MKPTDNHLDGVIIEFLCKGVPASGMSLSLCAAGWMEGMKSYYDCMYRSVGMREFYQNTSTAHDGSDTRNPTRHSSSM